MESALPSYTDYTSLLQLFKVHAARYKDNVLVHYQLPNSTEFKSLTYGQVDNISSYLASLWGPTISADTECIALLSDDPAQSILAFFTVLKLGRIFFPLSTYRSKATVVHLLQKSNAGYLIASTTHRIKALECAATLYDVSRFDIHIWDDFDIDQLIIATMTKAETSCKNGGDVNQSRDDAHNIRLEKDISDSSVPVTWLQSSGTTSEFPKAVLHTTRSIMYVVLEVFVKSIQEACPDLAMDSTDVILVTEKLFHGPAMITLVRSILYGASIVMFSNEIPTPREILDAADTYGATVMDMVPIFLMQLAQYLEQHAPADRYLAVLQRFKYCICTGAPLSRPIGDFLRAKGLNVQNGYGMTETGALCISDVSKNNDYWYSINVTKDMMRYVSLEPIIKDMHQSSGEKVHPTAMEMEICKEDVIQHCIIICEDNAWTAVLIELNENKASQFSAHEMASKANKYAPPHGIIFVPNMVCILPFDRKLPKTPKGTVKRKAVAATFAQEIEQMYKNLSFNTYLDVALSYYEAHMA
ncbi:hypothetical protein BDB00DRAFT_872356 [Zychaea mexicana]|uniref:uncharacterized protein n=1 Tax=Zychaea mexicana TaxID=64656 RepID=UPI0022FE3328|nr:uncharacterized protein BDB00DRAFT_872356 [Zychaea mexicana]KAI9493470.1 hypothetical protein BDB00DRAFT_872356 [Zychaea mexicana]